MGKMEMQIAFFTLHISLHVLELFLHLIKSAATTMQTISRCFHDVHIANSVRASVDKYSRLNFQSTILLMEFKYVFPPVCLFILIPWFVNFLEFQLFPLASTHSRYLPCVPSQQPPTPRCGVELRALSLLELSNFSSVYHWIQFKARSGKMSWRKSSSTDFILGRNFKIEKLSSSVEMLKSSPSFTNNQQSDNHYHLKLSQYAELARLHSLAAVAIKSENGGKKLELVCLVFIIETVVTRQHNEAEWGEWEKNGEKSERRARMAKKSIKTSTAVEDWLLRNL